MTPPTLALLIGAYLSGSLPFGLWLTRLFRGSDVRAQGSGNIGATNVARVAGKKVGAFVLLLDAVKGAVPAYLALWGWPDQPWLHVAASLAAVLGHVYPPWLRFRGGKGVATAFGTLTVLMPWVAAAGFVTYAVMVALFRVSSVGSLAAVVGVVGATVWLHPSAPNLALVGAFTVLIAFTHRSNIGRLVRRAERKV